MGRARVAAIGGALAGGLAFAFVLRFRQERQAETLDARSLAWGAIPYAVLVGLIRRIRDTLRQLVLQWTLPGSFTGRIEPLYHPGTMLLAGLVFGGLLQGRSLAELVSATAAAVRRLVPVAIALFAMLGIARLMVHAGMTEALAAAATQTGRAWPLLAPSVGALGSFITGSATASNILLTDLQQVTATELGLPLLPLIAAQGFGAAIGNCVALHNIIAGAATVGLQGREGDILRKTAPVCLVCLVAAGVLVLATALWS